MFGIAAAIYVYCTYVFVENKNLKPERKSIQCISVSGSKPVVRHSKYGFLSHSVGYQI